MIMAYLFQPPRFRSEGGQGCSHMLWSKVWDWDKVRGRKQSIFYCPWEKACLFRSSFEPSESHKTHCRFQFQKLCFSPVSSIPRLSRTFPCLLTLRCQKLCRDPVFLHVLPLSAWPRHIEIPGTTFGATKERRKRREVQMKGQTIWKSYLRVRA